MAHRGCLMDAQARSVQAPDPWRFDNSYLKLPALFYTCLPPVAVRAPQRLIFNHALADSLGLAALADDPQALAYFAGNAVPAGTTPFAQAYAGHQFGGFSILGDGRAVVLGEHIAADGQRVDIQLKGSGPTPYSRRGDGRAAVAPMLREYLISEALHHLGIPTTRSLAVVATGEPVFRQTALPGAVLTRVAASHLRVGTFQYAAVKGQVDDLQALLHYAIDRHYPAIAEDPNPALALLREVINVQADLIVNWMRVGFVHGVMNTDNMTISGETIDYGPCAFMDQYDRATVFSSIDDQGRYSFGNQPGIAQWNLLRLAEALLPLLDPDQEQAIEIAKQVIGSYAVIHTERFETMMLNKIGLHSKQAQQDETLITDLLDWMSDNELDYTNTFRDLGQASLPDQPQYQSDAFKQWSGRWRARLAAQGIAQPEVQALMDKTNPVYIARNHLVQSALDRAEQEGDLSEFHALLEVLGRPYEFQPGCDKYAEPASPKSGYMTFCGT